MQPESHERTNQKARTRADLLQAAIALIRNGERPTVEEAALAAGVSKRTAYRYFVSQDHLLADAALEGLRAVLGGMLEKGLDADDAPSRLSALAIAMNKLAMSHEAELRVMIRASLDTPRTNAGEPTRGQRRMDWINTALAPARGQLNDDLYDKLASALAVSLGIDALIILRDICGLSPDRIESVMTWSAQALFDAAMKEMAASADPATAST
jgi:AcrR family transcriptional regulator